MGAHSHDNALMNGTERLYLDLLYSRADAQLYDMPYVAHLLTLACQEMEKLAEAERSSAPAHADWNAFYMFPGMK